jgi:hypothetical protein
MAGYWYCTTASLSSQRASGSFGYLGLLAILNGLRVSVVCEPPDPVAFWVFGSLGLQVL